jgi:hypothetical protein
MKNLLGGIILLSMAASLAHATNPCDVSEEACKQWNQYLKDQEAFSQRHQEPTPLPPRYTGKYNDCPDGKELDGRSIEATVTFKDTGKSVVLKLSQVSCDVEVSRDEPPASPYTVRAYRSGDGAYLGVYSSADRPTSTISLRLADEASSASMIPAFRTDALASGKDVSLGDVLLVKLDKKGENGVVVPVTLTIRSVTP